MNSALLDIGVPCAAPDCPVLDFLPTRCPACSSVFCADHILADRHACPEPPPPPPAQHDRLARCAFQQCSKPTLDAYSAPGSIACPACHSSYCPEQALTFAISAGIVLMTLHQGIAIPHLTSAPRSPQLLQNQRQTPARVRFSPKSLRRLRLLHGRLPREPQSRRQTPPSSRPSKRFKL